MLNINLTIDIYSPVHIGVEDTKNYYSGIDFIQKNGYLYFIDKKKLLNYLETNEIANLLINRRLKSWLRDNVENLDDIAERKIIYDYEINDKIFAHIRNSLTNLPIIPGSSLKGAFRTVLYHYFFKKFGKFKNHYLNEFMRFYKFSDIEFNQVDIYPSKVFSLDRNKFGGWKDEKVNHTSQEFNEKKFITHTEVITIENEPAETVIKIESDLANLFQDFAEKANDEDIRPLNRGMIELINKPWEALCKIVNTYTEDYIQKEIEYHKKYNQAEYSDRILDFYQYLLSKIPNNSNSCMLRVGYGSGFHAMTGDTNYKNHIDTGIWYSHDPEFKKYKIRKVKMQQKLIGKPKWKTRKFAFMLFEDGFELMPLGYILLTKS